MNHSKQVIERSRLSEVYPRFARHKQAEPPIKLNVTAPTLFPAFTMTLQEDRWGLVPGWEVRRVGDPQFCCFVNMAVFRNDIKQSSNKGTASAVDTGLEVFQQCRSNRLLLDPSL